MQLNLKQIHGTRAHEHISRHYEASALQAPDDAYTIKAPVDLTFDLEKDRDNYHLVGQATTTLELFCGRCLESFSLPVRAPFDLRYLPHREDAGGDEREIEDDDLSTTYYDDETIDLGQLIREQLYLALPMKPLCDEDCQGLCPACGTNLNRERCGCDPKWEDPRLAALRTVIKKDSDA
ncbi:MAG TPA: DUF177 domain-containing protein [Vicinamibacterales bacterium]|jgi:uncharacterized protein